MSNIITEELNHDLPENWTDNQYVAPEGADVGLTEQHGYNYLMKQVNNTQRAVNELDAGYGNMDTKIGSTTDTGGSATAGSVMGKLNAIISSLLSHVSTWTAARAANLDASVSSRESEANAAARYNSIIATVSGSGKKLTAKKLVTSIPAGTTATVVNVTGGGVFYGGYVSTNQANETVTITIDGVPHVVGNNSSGAFGRGFLHGQMFASTSSNSGVIPAEFKNSLVITVTASSVAAAYFYCDYSLYE